ncbi:MAG: small subunit ribosomal protein S8e [Methanobacteriota archaeon]|jgi:small subunit ribosomal protein S8e|uniref:Small ribosomal subunit protein eS8 n=1 Tax=Halorutilus salinus TaxID=2487751 RepID=A0A9Q4C0M4_9EURY|nr:30S ribosomal protein S8e [Halorutilus salinus]MCX2817782.1 30S ribosomal protein S8e [Halorutilus salinus]
MRWQGRSTRKKTGGRRKRGRKKRKHELGDEPTETQIGEEKFKTVVVRGGERKTHVLQTDKVNYIDGGETDRVEIQNVAENGANPNYARRDIITKGAIIETPEGRARVVSRPGQDGVVNAVAVDG